MTGVVLYKTRADVFKGIDVTGHAGFADKGSDIVCAAVSFLTINTINAIDRLTADEITVDENKPDGVIILRFRDTPSREAALLLEAFEMGVTELAARYKEITTEVRYVTDI